MLSLAVSSFFRQICKYFTVIVESLRQTIPSGGWREIKEEEEKPKNQLPKAIPKNPKKKLVKRILLLNEMKTKKKKMSVVSLTISEAIVSNESIDGMASIQDELVHARNDDG